MNLPPQLHQNVINLVKINYKKPLLTHLLGEKETNLKSKLKNFNPKNAVQILHLGTKYHCPISDNPGTPCSNLVVDGVRRITCP